MRPIRHATFVLFGCFLLGVAGAEELPRAKPSEAGLSADKLDRVKTVIQTAVEKNQTAGVVLLIARHGKIAYLESFGKMDASTGKPMAADSIFRIYSMTKPITSVAALMLYDEGKLKLDDPVAKYLPEFKGLRVHTGKGDETVEAKREMTIRDLMRHTSGLTYGMFGASPVDKLYLENKVMAPSDSLADMARKLGKLPLQCEPGTKFNYSVSTDILGRVVEVVSGKSFDEFLAERIFKPLDMHDTGFAVRGENLDRFTANHRVESGSLKVSDPPATSRFRTQPKFLSGGGGLVSTARDYARFGQMLLNGGELGGTRLLRAETVREMTTNQLPAEALPMSILGMSQPGMGFGLGVSVRMDANSAKPQRGAGEFGWSGLASTYFWVAPKEEMVVVVLQQVEPFNVGLMLALKPAIYAAVEE